MLALLRVPAADLREEEQACGRACPSSVGAWRGGKASVQACVEEGKVFA